MNDLAREIRALVLAWMALCTLLALTILTALFNLGTWNFVLNLGIAGLKTLLIGIFFMHLKDRDKLMRLFAVAGMLWLAAMFGLTAADYLFRPLA